MELIERTSIPFGSYCLAEQVLLVLSTFLGYDLYVSIQMEAIFQTLFSQASRSLSPTSVLPT